MQDSEWAIKFKGPFLDIHILVHIVHLSHVIITYTLESWQCRIEKDENH